MESYAIAFDMAFNLSRGRSVPPRPSHISISDYATSEPGARRSGKAV